jgi:hypothetical protein
MGVPGKPGRIDHPFHADCACARHVDLDAADFAMLIGSDRRQKGVSCIHLSKSPEEQDSSGKGLGW